MQLRLQIIRAIIICIVIASYCPNVLADSLIHTYDDLNRLTRVEYGNGVTIDYIYDEVGNRTVKTMKGPPVVGFTATPTSGGVPFVVNLTNSSINATSWLWNFGDGTSSILQNPPPHVYKTAGNYSLSLAVTNIIGMSSTAKSITATTCATQPVKIGANYYASLQAAYNAAADGSAILILARDFTENLSAGLGKVVTLDGGYVCGFTGNPDTTVLHGAPHISAGTVKLKNIRIAQ